VIVRLPTVRSLFVQREIGEYKGNWMTIVQEYELEFKLANIIKFLGMCKLEIESLDSIDQHEEGWEEE
jgi:hypothetical protein